MRYLNSTSRYKDIHLFDDFLSLIYPKCCETCENKLQKLEELICSNCRIDMPRVNIDDSRNNQVHLRMAGRFPLEYAFTYYHYRKNSKVKLLLQALKYKGCKEIGTLVGKWMGAELLSKNIHEPMIVIPVPLHISRMKQRGYNQSEYIAIGLAETLKMPLNNVDLIKKESTNTQTLKGRWARWMNVAHIYEASDKLVGKHILLVDDVITTGATIEACVEALLKVGVSKISVVSIAMADKNDF
jgi:ComF family protein